MTVSVAFALLLLTTASAQAGKGSPSITHADFARQIEPLHRTLQRGQIKPQLNALAASGLPMTWCGTPTTTDDTANQASSGPDYKLVYAYPADQPNRFDQLANYMQADVSGLSRYMAWTSAGNKTIRFDMGTSCGAQYVDITTVALPHPLAYYQFPDPGADRSGYNVVHADLVIPDVAAAMHETKTAPVRNFVVFWTGSHHSAQRSVKANS